MADSKITVQKNGPFRVEGENIQIADPRAALRPGRPHRRVALPLRPFAATSRSATAATTTTGSRTSRWRGTCRRRRCSPASFPASADRPRPGAGTAKSRTAYRPPEGGAGASHRDDLRLERQGLQPRWTPSQTLTEAAASRLRLGRPRAIGVRQAQSPESGRSPPSSIRRISAEAAASIRGQLAALSEF